MGCPPPCLYERAMERLRRGDLLAVLGLVRSVGTLRALDAFQRQTIVGLSRLVACDLTSYNEVSLGKSVFAVIEPACDFLPAGLDILARYGSENPLIAHSLQSGESNARKFSDFITQDDLHRRELYQQLYRRLRVEYQMAFELPARRSVVVGIALSRANRDFLERDRAVLDILQPHLAQTYRNLAFFEGVQQAFAAGGQAIVSLDRSGRVRYASDAARRLLIAYLGNAPNLDRELPEAIRTWVRHELARQEIGDDVPPPADTLVIEGLIGQLVVRFLPAGDLVDDGLLLLEERAVPDSRNLRALGLSPREAEVLTLVSQGKSDAAVADVLVVSQRTVQKHLERIYDKLGVRTRTAAAALAFQQLRPVRDG